MAGDEYEVVPLHVSWASLSVFCFLLTLPIDFLLRLQPWRPDRLWLWPLVPVATIFGLSLVGSVCGGLGLRFSANRGMAKIGLFLNGVVLAIVVLVIAGMVFILTVR